MIDNAFYDKHLQQRQFPPLLLILVHIRKGFFNFRQKKKMNPITRTPDRIFSSLRV